MSETSSQSDKPWLSKNDRGSHWLLTWNNPVHHEFYNSKFVQEHGRLYIDYQHDALTPEEAKNVIPHIPQPFIDAFLQDWDWDGQMEVGELGTRHYQFYVNTHKQVRFAALKKVFPMCHIEKTINRPKVEAYCKKLSTRQSQSQNSEFENEKYTTKQFWEDLARIWPDFENLTEDEMENFDCATRCLIDLDIPCFMLAVQPQVRKAFQLYGTRIMAQYARKDEKNTIEYPDETPAPLDQDRQLHEEQSSECSSESSEESDQEDDGEGSDQDTETASETSSECSGGE